MLIKIPAASAARENEVTPESIYLSRRKLIAAAGGLAMASAFPIKAFAEPYADVAQETAPDWFVDKLNDVRWKSGPEGGDTLTPLSDVTQYNNFYEFGTGKGDPARYAEKMQVEPWSVMIDGEVAKPGPVSLEALVQPHRLEERIYRLRCVEAWSMVIPWLGFPLSALLEQARPTSRAKFVRFETHLAPKEMAGVRSGFSLIDWPYKEGLRLDEAMHPLAFLAVGLYGRVLPNQNGAPLRLVVPWKYGFKSIKSIVRISLVAERPATTWEALAPDEYGFYANVNPEVDHPRWSQATERRLPNSLFNPNVVPTRLFNGYDEVSSLYSGLDLRKNY